MIFRPPKTKKIEMASKLKNLPELKNICSSYSFDFRLVFPVPFQGATTKP